MMKHACIFKAANFIFRIRVEHGDDKGNNKLCFRQSTVMISASANFTCSPFLFGDWISIQKVSSNNGDDDRLWLREVRVFGVFREYYYM